MKRQILLIFPVLLLIASMIALTFLSMDADPIVVLQPKGARSCAEGFLNAVSEGDLTAAKQYLSGAADLRTPQGGSAAAQALWNGFYSGFRYTLAPGMSAAGMTVTLEADITCAPAAAVLDSLKAGSQAYSDETVLIAAVEEALRSESRTVTMTVRLIRENGRWQIVPSQQLLDLITGQVIA